MPKFSLGDPVWARSYGALAPPGEYAGIVINTKGCGCPACYKVEIENRGNFNIREPGLRPRRDDYQQHEGLGSRDKLTDPLAPELNEESIEALLEVCQRGLSHYLDENA